MGNNEKQPKPLCNGDCWHYTVYGGREGCGQKSGEWDARLEPIRPGEVCFYPEKRHICKPVCVLSAMGFDGALEGEIIKGGPHDNSSIIMLLTNSGHPSR